MGEVKRTVSSLVRTLERKQKEAESLVDVMDKLESHLEKRPKEILMRSLDLLLWKIKDEAAEKARTGHLLVAIIDHEGRMTIGETYDKDSDSWLKRLKSEGFSIATVDELSLFIESLKSEVVAGNFMRSIKFLNQNAGPLRRPSAPSPVSTARTSRELKPSEPSSSSRWGPSDFLPAPPPYPPLPRGLFKD